MLKKQEIFESKYRFRKQNSLEPKSIWNEIVQTPTTQSLVNGFSAAHIKYFLGYGHIS